MFNNVLSNFLFRERQLPSWLHCIHVIKIAINVANLVDDFYAHLVRLTFGDLWAITTADPNSEAGHILQKCTVHSEGAHLEEVPKLWGMLSVWQNFGVNSYTKKKSASTCLRSLSSLSDRCLLLLHLVLVLGGGPFGDSKVPDKVHELLSGHQWNTALPTLFFGAWFLASHLLFVPCPGHCWETSLPTCLWRLRTETEIKNQSGPVKCMYEWR